jgi:hypothetical protein
MLKKPSLRQIHIAFRPTCGEVEVGSRGENKLPCACYRVKKPAGRRLLCKAINLALVTRRMNDRLEAVY